MLVCLFFCIHLLYHYGNLEAHLGMPEIAGIISNLLVPSRWAPTSYKWVFPKIGGKKTKMDGENNGKPY